jgi:Fe-S-cluster-containing hydrogenase component 2
MRFSESSCQRCVAICPHGAVTLDGGLAIHAERCRGCLLCTAVCPVGALEQGSDFFACLAQLSRLAEPVLGCIRTKEHSNATLVCLGGLSEEHLLALYHTCSGKLTLNLALCSGCPNNTMIARLKQRVEALSEAGLAGGDCKLVMAVSAEAIHCRAESVDRRSFFKSFRTALFASTAVMLSANIGQTERRNEYSRKRLPMRRALLNSTRRRVSQEMHSHIQTFFDYLVSFNKNCTQCQGCVAICPTGALKIEQPDGIPTFDSILCTGCGLCREFCMDEALRISRAGNDQEDDNLLSG